ncbi:hypothetical protein D8Z77_03975 [Brevibacillus laterosporus]|nr:hypothetical protein D8Z77_03975 [Brevibacillus laterosporus]
MVEKFHKNKKMVAEMLVKKKWNLIFLKILLLYFYFYLQYYLIKVRCNGIFYLFFQYQKEDRFNARLRLQL